MFLIVPSENPSKLKAQISEDNLCIEWDKTLSSPPWDDLYMEQYHKEFEAAYIEWKFRK